MMNRKLWIGAAVLGCLAFGGAAQAQEQDVFFEAQAAPPEMGTPGIPVESGTVAFTAERVELLGFGGMHGGKVVKGAPFSAVSVSETVETLADGNRIVRKTQTSLYRDSQGRFRRETTLPALGPLAAAAPMHSLTEIHDPVAGTGYLLEPEEKIARKIGHPGGPMTKSAGPGGAGISGSVDHNVMFFQRSGRLDDANVKKEDLGTQVVNGTTAQGTRITRTIAAGEIGNERPLVIVNESWYSSDLQMVVESKRSDPRFGETTYKLTNLQRTEPDASLFTVPAGYTVEEGGPRMRFNKRLMPPPPPGTPAPEADSEN